MLHTPVFSRVWSPMFVLTFLLSLGLSLVLSCVSAQAEPSPESSEPVLLVDHTWLAEHRTASWMRIVDARQAQAYQAGHIDGAVNLPADMTFDAAPQSDIMVPLGRAQELLRQAGIGESSYVVIYDGGSYLDATRLFWVLEVFGHTRVALLNGGLPQWQKATLPQSQEPVIPEPSHYTPTVIPYRMATTFSTHLAIQDPWHVIVDARPAAEYHGRQGQATRPGHIPGALNIPWSQHIEDVDGVRIMKSVDALAKLYEHIDPQQKVVAYCNTGRQSALTYFVLRHLGYDVAAYDGAWFDAGHAATLPSGSPLDAQRSLPSVVPQ